MSYLSSDGNCIIKCWNPLHPAPCMEEKKDQLHRDPFSEAIRYPLRGPAHFMGPLAFSMASDHGHCFRIRTAEKPYSPPLLARCEAYMMCKLFKRFSPYTHSMGGGPRVIGTAGHRPEKRHTICRSDNNTSIVCKHTMSELNTTSYMTLQYRIPDIVYCMSKKVPTKSYTIYTYDVVCIPPTTSYVFLNLQYRICLPCDLQYRMYLTLYCRSKYDTVITYHVVPEMS
jgi:hypothetical protein